MSHKNKTLSWYSLMLRIGKMTIHDAKNNIVTINIGGKEYPVELSFDQTGRMPVLRVKKED